MSRGLSKCNSTKPFLRNVQFSRPLVIHVPPFITLPGRIVWWTRLYSCQDLPPRKPHWKRHASPLT